MQEPRVEFTQKGAFLELFEPSVPESTPAQTGGLRIWCPWGRS
jgi:hypothetical protein